jgi:hypothetical protein
MRFNFFSFGKLNLTSRYDVHLYIQIRVLKMYVYTCTYIDTYEYSCKFIHW